MYTGNLGLVSNRETWSQTFSLEDENGDAVRIVGIAIELAIRKQGYCTPCLQASVGEGITVSSPSFTFTFDKAQLQSLESGTYEVGITYKLGGLETQFLIATVTILDGIVR